MLFYSYAFVFLFFPITTIGFFFIRKLTENGAATAQTSLWGKAPLLWLLAVSLFFYAANGIQYLPVLLATMAVNYGLCLLLWKRGKNRLIYGIGVCFHILVLIGFKYTGISFVPLGISFFTFSEIAFLSDVYAGRITRTALAEYSIYMTFFPKIIEGPIALPGEFLRNLSEGLKKRFSYEACYRGVILFILGLAKKVLLADTFGSAVTYGYTNLASLNRTDAWVVMLSYSLQIYFDFSGYCDMAMGIAKCLNFDLPLNFDSPYRSGSILEFWKRWHITLTRFFTKYLYIPLGGSRKGEARTYLNMLLVFLVSGIWHGAGFPFIIWGLMHGILYVLTKWFTKHCPERVLTAFKRGPLHILCVLLTFLFVNVAWVFFRAPSASDACTLLQKLTAAGEGGLLPAWNLASCFNVDEFWYVIKVLHVDAWQYAHYILMAVLLLFGLILVFQKRTAVSMAENGKPAVWKTVFLAVLLVWCILSFSGVSSFIYVNF